MNGNDDDSTNSTNNDDDERLVEAIMDGNVMLVLELLLNHVNVNAIDTGDFSKGTTPLHHACQGTTHDHMDIVKFLIDFGADVHAKDQYGVTPLHQAVENCNQWEISKFLVWNGANVNAKDVSGWTPLHCACSQGQLEAIKFLLKNGAWINIKCSAGTTPLDEAKAKLEREPKHEHQAAMEVIQFLTENGAH